MPTLTLILAIVTVFVYADYAKQSLKEDKKFLQDQELIEECRKVQEHYRKSISEQRKES